MKRLFVKIFLWFWATVVVVGIALVLSFVLSPKGSYLPWKNMNGIAHNVLDQYGHKGAPGATSLLSGLERSQGLEACLYDEHGLPVAGNHCPAFQPMVAKAVAEAAERQAPGSDLHGVYRNLLRMRGDGGKNYFFATELPFGPGPVHHTLAGFAVHWLVMLLVSSGICYLLTLWLTRPILRLREASRQIADGHLQTRVAPGLEKRGDEFGDLARDFNTMAERIETLLSSQRQLISDVSHELRSPLTRIQLALDLIRKRAGEDPAFERVNADLVRLDDLIASLLTVARLESGAVQGQCQRVDLNGLLSEIAADAQIEARARNCTVVLEETGEYAVQGDEDMLRSAFENVVRNAVSYTHPGTEIRMAVAPVSPGTDVARIEISDHGPGVPENELENIFRPFYRIGDARDRQSGGTGLGLAIASRVIRLHQGTIHAENRTAGGLRVLIQLPLAAKSSNARPS